MRSLMAVVAVGLILTVAGTAGATSLVFDRGLPVTNLNNAAGVNRSNVAWGFGAANDEYFAGDDFKLSTSPLGQWQIDTVRIWIVAGAPAAGVNLADRYTQVSLFGGLASEQGINKIASGSFISGTSTTDNANIDIKPVAYSDGENYQGSSNAYIQLWQVDFNNLGWVVDGNMQYQFGVQGLSVSDYGWSNHASNAALGGANADGADNLYRWFYADGTTQVYGGGMNSNGNGGGWDKGSDINVQVFATAVPEPITMAGLMLGVGSLVGYVRRRAKK
jgi:hypothetical protein